MAGWYCADCGGTILLGTRGEAGLTLVCRHCDAEVGVNSIDPLEADWASDWDWVDDGASSQAGIYDDRHVDRIEGMRGRLDVHSLSGSMPWA
jgi:hypothetical protein